jgi:GT2 family glycosyltransferase
MGISVAIPTVGRVETLPTVLTSLAFQSCDIIREVILLDESKTPVMENYVVNQALDVLSLKHIDVKIIRNRLPKGIGAARLRLAREAKEELLFTIDDDVVLSPECLEELRCGIEQRPWAVPTCRLIPAGFASDGYIDNRHVDPEDPDVRVWTEKYPWFIPWFRYQKNIRIELAYAGTQAILMDRKAFLEVNGDLADLGRLPREDTVMTQRMGPGVFISAAETLHYEHQSQVGRANWSTSVHYRLHEAAAKDPELFVKLMSLK